MGEEECKVQLEQEQQQHDIQMKELKEKKSEQKLARKGSTKYQRRFENRQTNNSNGKTFHIKKLTSDEIMTTNPPLTETSVHRAPADNLDSILSNITITYQELRYCGSIGGKTETIKKLK